MRAAVIRAFGGPEQITMATVDTPTAAPDEVLIRVSAAGINPIDCKSRRGYHKYILGKNFPIILGWDVCGEVMAIGSQCKRFKPGDRVFGRTSRPYGQCYAEVVACRENNLAVKPDRLTDSEAAAVPMAALTALQALRDKGNLQARDKVLIIGGSGGVGHFALQIAHLYGTETWAVYSPRNRTLIEPLAPHHWVDYTHTDPLSLPIRFDIIFDIAGKYNWKKCRRILSPKGVYITSLPRPIVLWHKLLSAITRHGSAKTLLMKASHTDMELMRQWIEQEKISPLVTRTFDLDQTAEAHHYFEQGTHAGKVVITVAQ